MNSRLVALLRDPAEAAFLIPLLADPPAPGPGPRDRYLAWLATRDDPRAEVARLLRELDDDPAAPRAAARRARLRELWSVAPPEWWGLVGSARWILNCGRDGGAGPRARFATPCEATWEGLDLGADPQVRPCGRCGASVRYCGSIGAAQDAAKRGDAAAIPATVASEVSRRVAENVTGHPNVPEHWARALYPSEDPPRAAPSAPATAEAIRSPGASSTAASSPPQATAAPAATPQVASAEPSTSAPHPAPPRPAAPPGDAAAGPPDGVWAAWPLAAGALGGLVAGGHVIPGVQLPTFYPERGGLFSAVALLGIAAWTAARSVRSPAPGGPGPDAAASSGGAWQRVYRSHSAGALAAVAWAVASQAAGRVLTPIYYGGLQLSFVAHLVPWVAVAAAAGWFGARAGRALCVERAGDRARVTRWTLGRTDRALLSGPFELEYEYRRRKGNVWGEVRLRHGGGSLELSSSTVPARAEALAKALARQTGWPLYRISPGTTPSIRTRWEDS